MSEVRIERLSKRFGTHQVLRGVNLSVASGRLVAILGPSGSGKTTLLRLLCGFERQDEGAIWIGDTLMSGPSVHVPSERRRIGYVPQEGALFPHLSVADNIVFGLPRALRQARHRVAELLELVGLPQSYAARPPQELSGGQQQRVALARALAPAPALVLLDEPFSSLDAALRIETRQAVAQALTFAGATALLVTHDPAEAIALADRVLLVEDGAIAMDLRVDLPRPRALGSAAFAALQDRLLRRLLQSDPAAPVAEPAQDLGDISLQRSVSEVRWAI